MQVIYMRISVLRSIFRSLYFDIQKMTKLFFLIRNQLYIEDKVSFETIRNFN